MVIVMPCNSLTTLNLKHFRSLEVTDFGKRTSLPLMSGEIID